MKKLVMVSSSSGDWEGLYVDGVLFSEGHSLSSREVLSAAGIKLEEKNAAEGWLEEQGCLPTKLKDVKFE
jgi:hypothetical protein